MATTIANLTTKADGSMEGVFATLRVNAPITLIPNTNKSREDAPDYRIVNKRTGFAIGAGWHRISQLGRGIPLGQAGSPRDRRDLRQSRSRPWWRGKQEGHPLEQPPVRHRRPAPRGAGFPIGKRRLQ